MPALAFSFEFSLSHALFGVLLLSFLGGTWAVCPHCHGNFASCDFATSKTCPSVSVVEKNAVVVAAGAGLLTLTGLIKPRFLRIFSKVAFETILALVKRAEPGSGFEIDKSTTVPALLTAISNGLTTMELAVLRYCELIEAETDTTMRETLTRRLGCLKTAADIRSKLPSEALTNLHDSGILTFLYAKVSEFVTKKEMQIRLSTDSGSARESHVDLAAKLFRPTDLVQFSEMLNLFTMYAHALAVANVLVVTDFFEHVVFDTVRRGESWKVAHELMLILFRRIEDSGGRLTLGNAFEEIYLNTAMVEAAQNAAVFFRAPGGSPGNVTNPKVGGKPYNGKFTASGPTCRFYNTGAEHPPEHLLPDGTCKFNHVCDQWVSNKGKKGRCLCTAGTAGHSRATCDNPNKCDAPVSK
jgi:hypothetical protein